MGIHQFWNRIENWLHLRQVDCASVLADGVSEEELNYFEHTFLVRFPKDFRSSFLIHNGFREPCGLIYGGNLLSITEIKNKYEHLKPNEDWKPFLFPIVIFNDYAFWCLDLHNSIFLDVTIDSKNSKITYETFHLKHLETS